MSNKRSNTETPATRLNRKNGAAAPKVARKSRLSPEAIVELSTAPAATPSEEAVAAPPVVEPVIEVIEVTPPPPVERLPFRPAPAAARRPSPVDYLRALVERARLEIKERTTEVQQRLSSRFPLLAAIHRSLSRRV